MGLLSVKVNELQNENKIILISLASSLTETVS